MCVCIYIYFDYRLANCYISANTNGKMLRFIVLFALLATSAFAIDKEVFKNCSRISFCSNFRNNVPDENSTYSAKIWSIQILDNVAVIPLTNGNDGYLNLGITLLSGDKARVKISEPNSTRFELGDIILENEPNVVDIYFDVIINDTALPLRPKDESNLNKVIVVQGPPFSIEFYYNDTLEVVLSGKRFIMENSTTSQVYTFAVEFEGASTLYGLHHHAYDLALKATTDGITDPFRFRNSDAYGYEANSTMALYGTVPAIYGHSENGTSGIFLHNAAEQWVDISHNGSRPSAYFMVESAAFDLFVLFGPTPKDVVRQFTNLTGRAHMPQLWTLGYHQCRFSYTSQEDVKEVVALMDKNDFPLDAIWLDGDHSDGNKWFTWNSTTFTDPIEMQNNISSTNRKCVSISDPHIKVDDNYTVYAGAKKDYFVKWANGTNYEGDCWPGLSSYIDFLNPEASDYYSNWYQFNKFVGSTSTLAGIWNDMNEPAVFDDSLEKTIPFEVLHNGPTGTVPHGDIHNIYGFLQTRSTHKGLMARDKNEKRPFILTRSHFAGSQRYAAMWTGDNTASWEHFAVTYPECMTANIVGMVFCGADIGGFIGNPSDELLQRWYQAAVWLPFFRGHSSRESNRREPYLFSSSVQTVIRNAIKLRYQHIPVFYTLFFEHTRTGDPIIRPLFYDYPWILERNNQLLLGSHVMAVAVTTENASTVEVQFPGTQDDVWYNFNSKTPWSVHVGNTTENISVDISSSPVFYKGGSIITRKEKSMRCTADGLSDHYTLYVNLNMGNAAFGTFYIDDFTSFNYENKNSYLYTNISYESSLNRLHVRVIDGSPGDFVAIINQIVVHNTTYSNDDIKATKMIHTKTLDGRLVASIDIGKELGLLRGEDLFILLENK